MKDRAFCTQLHTLLPLYVNGNLAQEQRAMVAQHLAACTTCQEEVRLWRLFDTLLQEDTWQIRKVQRMPISWEMISTRLSRERAQIEAPGASFHQRFRIHVQIVGELLWSQIRIIQHDFWWISALGIPMISAILFLSFTWQTRVSISSFVAPLIAALGMSFLYNQSADPPHEMIRATPTSSGVIVLCRLSIVFAFNMLINLMEALPFLFNNHGLTWEWVLNSWFAPLGCLMALALFLSIIAKPIAAIITCSMLWLLRVVINPVLFVSGYQANGYENIWHQGSLLLCITVVALTLTFILLERKEEVHV